MDPVNLVESVPPNVSSPFVFPTLFVGSNEIATRSCWMIACWKRLSTTVGTLSVVSGERVPIVRGVGPRLCGN